jgi:hypothetical protein
MATTPKAASILFCRLEKYSSAITKPANIHTNEMMFGGLAGEYAEVANENTNRIANLVIQLGDVRLLIAKIKHPIATVE